MSDIEVRSRLTSLLDVLEHERDALKDSGDARLDETVRGIMRLKSEIAAVIESFSPPAGDGRSA
jgi:hypothetical protein